MSDTKAENYSISQENLSINSLAKIEYLLSYNVKLPLIEHYHKTKIEFIIILDGMQKFYINSVLHTFYSGDVAIIKPNELHNAVANSSDNLTEILWFQLDLSEAENFLSLSGITGREFYKMVASINTRKFQAEPLFLRNFVTCFKLFSSDNINNKIKAQGLFVYCLSKLLETKSALDMLSTDIEYAKEYIHLHFDEVIDMDILSSKSNISLSQFKEKFKSQIGYYPKDYINFVKIQKAKKLLLSTKKSVLDIAYEAGFSTGKFFTIVFKQIEGISPKEYRKKNLKKKS